jgi:hypothetical protein
MGQLKLLTRKSVVAAIPYPDSDISPAAALARLNFGRESRVHGIAWRNREAIPLLRENESSLLWWRHTVVQISQVSLAPDNMRHFPIRGRAIPEIGYENIARKPIAVRIYGANQHGQYGTLVKDKRFSREPIRDCSFVGIPSDEKQSKNVYGKFPEFQLLEKRSAVGLTLLSLILTGVGARLVKFNLTIQSNTHCVLILIGGLMNARGLYFDPSYFQLLLYWAADATTKPLRRSRNTTCRYSPSALMPITWIVRPAWTCAIAPLSLVSTSVLLVNVHISL